MKIFCDLDGTLLDVSVRHYRVYKEVVALYNGTALPQPEYWDLKRKKLKWNILLPQSGLSADIEPEFLQEFIRRIEDPEYLKLDQLFPHSKAVLGTLSQKYDCYLVSLRRNRQNLLEELAWLQIEPYFKQILTGHSENDGYDVKIELIRTILQDDQGVIIGDTEADVITGKQLGLTTVAVKGGIRDEKFLEALEPDYLLPNVEGVPSLVEAGKL